MDERLTLAVEVAVNRPLYTTFAYKVNCPADYELTGSRVKLNFAGTTEVGIIVARCNLQELKIGFDQLKSCTLLDQKNFMSPDVFGMVAFGSIYYHHPLGQVWWTALPKILREGGDFAYEQLPGLQLKEEAAAKPRPKSSEQNLILDLLKNGPLRRKELRERGIRSQSEQALLKKGLVSLVNLSCAKHAWMSQADDVLAETPPEPNPEQAAAIAAVSQASGYQVFLLHGVTGSGKTEVYMQVIATVLSRRQSVLVLVPEIALTPQTFNRFYRRFKVPVASMHSQLSDRERLDAYLDMSQDKAAILIGTRTALFTPIRNLGLIILDEEHDSSFKQSDGFRYHARDLALKRASLANCPVILGSATPSLESYYLVQTHQACKLTLTSRAGGASFPDFKVLDLRREPFTDGLAAGISQSLENKIGEETAKGNQVLLFLNRRGFSHHLLCHQCGHVFSCPNCDNVLTVHQQQHKLSCHICENSIPLPKSCPVCGCQDLEMSGIGTEQVESFLSLRYPDLQIERIDRDNVTTKSQLEQRLDRIRQGKSQILVGTQMLAKGHDFPNITLVGILDLDSGLFSDDYRSLEMTAQLITQVSGRSGRASKKGEVYIQTHYPDNYLLNQIISQSCSYDAIALSLLEQRATLQLPPYGHQAFLLSNSTDRVRAYSFLTELRSLLEAKAADCQVTLSPVLSDKMEKRQNRYHFHLLASSSAAEQLQDFLKLVTASLNNVKLTKDTRFAIEVDPLIMY
ncbi:MAG: primosomal protein N' [Succinivibrio sp.]|nr:primosomal protein N' [Succinivibrio sp.]